MASQPKYEAALREVQRAFAGQQIDNEVLESVLELFNGNAREAVNFLRSQGAGDYVEPPPAPGGTGGRENLPKDYFDAPKGVRLSNAPAATHEQTATTASTVSISAASASGASPKDIKEIILGDHPLSVHLDLLSNVRERYLAVLVILFTQGVDLPTSTKGKILAAAYVRHDREMQDYLMSLDEHIGLPEVLRAVKLLDAPRKIRAIEKRIARLQSQGKAKARTLGLVRSKLNDLKKETPDDQRTAVTGALAKRICAWIRRQPADKLQFFALQMPREPWQEIADVIHCKPDDFALPWFLPVAFGAPPPEGSLLAAVGGGAGAAPTGNLTELAAKFRIPYSYVRKHVDVATLPAEVRVAIARYETLDTLVWYYEELTAGGGASAAAVDEVIAERLERGEEPGFGYGKLMERLLFFRLSNMSVQSPLVARLLPVAEKRLKALRLPLEPPVVVLGDASYSMDVAIRTATIIASLLAALTNADLRFFNVTSYAPPSGRAPRTVSQVLDVVTTTRADGLTAPAVALMEFYAAKRPVKFFVVVTDEIENEKHAGTFFAQLFCKYYQEVFPARLVFVSFLDNPKEKGRMVRALEQFAPSIGGPPLQFRLDARRPDLTKLDVLLGLLAAQTNFFDLQVSALEETLRGGSGPAGAIKKLGELVPAQPAEQASVPEYPAAAAAAVPETKGKEKVGAPSPAPSPSPVSTPATGPVVGGEQPDEFICPITNDVMVDPVVAADGHTYERAAIEAWFAKNDTSPITNAPLEVKMLFPNYSLRSRIKDYLATRKTIEAALSAPEGS